MTNGRRLDLAAAFAAVAAVAFYALAVVGCANLEKAKDWTCATAQASYAGYLAAVNAGLEVSPETVAGVTAAAGFLSAFCDWHSPANPARSLNAPTIDARGVPILLPP